MDYLDTPEARRWAMRVRTKLLSDRAESGAPALPVSPAEAEALAAVERARSRLALALAEGLVAGDTPDGP
jgi:Lon protease-like protein